MSKTTKLALVGFTDLNELIKTIIEVLDSNRFETAQARTDKAVANTSNKRKRNNRKPLTKVEREKLKLQTQKRLAETPKRSKLLPMKKSA